MALARSAYGSIADLARALDVAPPEIFQVIAGSRPGKSLMPKIAEKLGVDERWLRFDDQDVRPKWAINEEFKQQLAGVTARIQQRVADAKPEQTSDAQSLELLRQILAEMQAQRSLLEQLVGTAPGRQAAQKSHVYQIGDLARQKGPVDAQ